MKKKVPESWRDTIPEVFFEETRRRSLLSCFLLQLLFLSVFTASGSAGRPEKLLLHPQAGDTWSFTAGLVRRELNRKPYNHPDPDGIIRALMEMDCGEMELSPYDEKQLQAAIEDRRWDWGLKLDSAYRFSDSRIDISRNTGYIGLTWDILKSGLLEEHSKSRQDQYKLGLVRLQALKNRLNLLLPCREIALSQMFSALKTALLELKEELLVIDYRARREAYFSGKILLDDLLKIEGEVRKSQDALLLNRTINSFDLDSSPLILPERELPLLQIRIKPLLEAVKKEYVNLDAIKLREKLLREKSNYLYDNWLRLYLRSGFDREEGENDYGTFVFGARFSAPIGKWGRRENSIKLKKIRFQNNQKVRKMLLQTVRLVNGYEERVKDAVTMNYRELFAKERLRRVWLLNRKKVAGGGVLDVTRSLTELIDIRLSRLDLQEKLYHRLLHIFTRTGVRYRDEFLEQRKSRFPVTRGRTGKRAIYLWSGSFNKWPNDFILQVCEAKSISRVIVSYSSKSEVEKLNSFLILANTSGVEVELMAGTNEWIFPDRGGRVADFTDRVFSRGNTVHLDVEPHTLPGYRKSEPEYKKYYIDMLKKVSEEREGTLSVSIPLKWSGAIFEKISRLADRIYLMAYGVTNPEDIERRLAPFLDSEKENLVIAVRPEDFSSEWEMEKFLDDLFIRTGVGQYAIHDFSAFLKMVSRESL